MPDVKLINGDCLDVLKTLPDNSVEAVVTDPPAGIGFMGKEWDHHKGGRDQWVAWMQSIATECMRVLKPGGHALVWAIPRTSHWTATAWENAGFEVRDRIGHIFGSGFPKSADVSKLIDKAAGAEREVVKVVKKTPSASSNCNDGWVRPWAENKTTMDITAPATEAAKQWQGWGTALKPAVEDWWLLRKPLIGTVVANVLAHGTGALNIDACRVATDDKLGGGRLTGATKVGDGWDRPWMNDPDRRNADAQAMAEKVAKAEEQGRWPANVIHDGSDEVLGVFPQSNSARANGNPNNPKRGKNHTATSYGQGDDTQTHDYRDTGSAARFFYCAKASKADRNSGGVTSTHPTVKPTDLMRYLCRLVTPPNGTILDPFMGSGSTGKGAMLEGFNFIGIEREVEYFEIAKARIAAVRSPQESTAVCVEQEVFDLSSLD